MSRSWLANTTPPPPSELPSRPKLIGASLLVIALTAIVFATIVLPAEWGIDPTGIGEVTGLTEMGHFKVEAAAEFAAIAAIAAQNAADSAAAARRSIPPAQ